MRFDTMPSNPILQAWSEHGRAIGLDMLIDTDAGRALASSEVNVTLHTSSGSAKERGCIFGQARPFTHCQEPIVKKIDAFKLYALGAALFPIHKLKGGRLTLSGSFEGGTTWGDAHNVLLFADAALTEFLKDNIYGLQTSLRPGQELLASIKELRSKIEDFSQRAKKLDPLSCSGVQQRLSAFTNVIRFELPELPIYLVAKKGGHDTTDLIERGEVFFPVELAKKVPGAISDVQQGARCIAFELPTAAGYHFHRANEAVLRVYWNIVTNNAPPPRDRSIGAYLREMDNRNAGSASIKASLRDLAKYHRKGLSR